MIKCVRILFNASINDDFLHTIIQKTAREHRLEGLVQMVGIDQIKIIACGPKEKVDAFVDEMHKEMIKREIINVEVEPFLKDKDYRGVFRVIE